MIGDAELEELIQLKVDNARLQRELSEALRQLNKSTGMIWDKVIAQRALPWIARETCDDCKGRGEQSLDAWSRAAGVEPQQCTTCNGSGEVYRVDDTKLHRPDQPPCFGCPNVSCNDYELCAKKKNPQ